MNLTNTTLKIPVFQSLYLTPKHYDWCLNQLTTFQKKPIYILLLLNIFQFYYLYYKKEITLNTCISLLISNVFIIIVLYYSKTYFI